MDRFTLDDYAADTETVARNLLGAVLVRRIAGARLSGRIVETEAYVGEEDLACHASRGRTPRTEVMFGPPGRAYVCLIYGMYHCLNVVTRKVDRAEAVLVRAVEPLDGVDEMRERRRSRHSGSPPRRTQDVASGPGKLCQAFAIDLSLNGANLAESDESWIERGRTVRESDIKRGPRVGIGYAAEWAEAPLRFWVRDSTHVSRRG